MPAAKGSKKKAVADEVTAATQIVESAPTPKKKAAKKPVKVVAVVTADGIDGSFSPEPRRPLIAHLQIRTNEVLFHDQALRYDPNPPSAEGPAPYDAADGDMFTAGQEHVESRQLETSVTTPVAVASPAVEVPRSMPCFTRADLMVQFKAPSQERRLPSNTEIACFWCAHTFEGMPCIIPEREVDMVYMVYGNFCSPGCGIAYLLTESLDPHVRWERMALLHRVYDSNGTGRIFPAPARESLKLFGGPMSIDVFRATMYEKKVRVDVHMPPMVSILGSIDTKPIDFFDTNLKQGGALQVVPQRSVEEGLRLKRSKPLKERESTLDTVMNIKIGGGRRAAT
jgi:hypothetical protein